MAKEPSKLSRKIDQICRVLFLTEDGKPKSASLLYSFALSLLFVIVYIAVFAFMPDFQAVLKTAPATLIYVFELISISVVGTLPCLAFLFILKKNRNLVPGAFIWMCVIVAFLFVGMALLCDWNDGATDYLLFLYIVGGPAVACAAVGTVSSHCIYKKWKQKEEKKALESKPKRPSYYDT